MIDIFIDNPLLNPNLIPVLLRVVYVLGAGFVLIVILNKFKIKNIWESHVGQRYLGWLIIVPIYLFSILFGGIVAYTLLITMQLVAIKELLLITRIPRYYFFILILIAFFSNSIALWYSSLFNFLPLFYFITISIFTIIDNKKESSFITTSITFFFAIWVLFGSAHLILLNNLNTSLDISKTFLLTLGFAVSLSDIMAYVVGNFFKKINFLNNYKIAENISPKKTYIGALGNILGAGIGVFIMSFALVTYLPWWHWIILSILIGIFGIIGDLIASVVKRGFDVKDTGDFIIGHGGILDRADSLILAGAVTYYYILFSM
jgi:phosphatidate cytidylyltransferase